MGRDSANAGAPVSYRGFTLRQERNLGWRVEPPEAKNRPFGEGREAWGEFSTPPSSLADVQALIDWRLDQAA
jgi:hypothetical protein